MFKVNAFFDGYPEARSLFNAILTLVNRYGEVELKVTKSQVAFQRKRAFAWVWVPEKYLHGKVAPLVLSISLEPCDPSTRWKEIVEPAPGRFMHHLELYAVTDIDEEVGSWLRRAWELAG